MKTDQVCGEIRIESPRLKHGDEWLTINQAARYLGCTPKSLLIRRSRFSGPISVRLPGRQIAYRRRALDAWRLARGAA